MIYDNKDFHEVGRASQIPETNGDIDLWLSKKAFDKISSVSQSELKHKIVFVPETQTNPTDLVKVNHIRIL